MTFKYADMERIHGCSVIRLQFMSGSGYSIWIDDRITLGHGYIDRKSVEEYARKIEAKFKSLLNRPGIPIG